MLGWYIRVKKRTFGGAIGYSSGKNSSSLNTPPAPARIIRTHVVHMNEYKRRAFERTPFRPLDRHIEVTQVVVVRRSGYARCRVALEALRFLRMSNVDGQHAAIGRIACREMVKHSI